MNDDQPIVIGPDGVPQPPAPTPPTPQQPSEPIPVPKMKRQLMPAFWYRWNRKKKIFALLAVILILVGVGTIVYIKFIHKNAGQSTKTTSVVDNRVPSPLTGLKVDPALAKRPVTGIMIENSLDARPQSGIGDAGVIFEAIAEGGITRFMTLFQDKTPQYIGPVRSLRPYYIDWASSFDASIAHIGGSLEALSQIRNGGKDLDQFFNASSYWREPSRPAPHDVYTSFDKLDALNKSKGYTSSTYNAWPRKADQKLATAVAKTIDFNISSAAFNVHYDYDTVSNNYLRSEGGVTHTATSSVADKTGIQLAPKVVIAMIMTYSIVDSNGHSGYGVNGSGTVYIFQDGGITNGTWSKADRSSQIVFTDTSSQPISLDAGQTWITAIQNGQISYAP